jgi:GTP-dependent phosphoenolpyruvate carboxykinase
MENVVNDLHLAKSVSEGFLTLATVANDAGILSTTGTVTNSNLKANTIEIRDNKGNSIVSIKDNGDIFWKGREIESDTDFKLAMIDVRDVLVSIYGLRTPYAHSI